MKVSEYLKKNFCVMELKAEDKGGAVREIAEVLAASGKVSNKEKFMTDILERESLGSTGIGHKVAIPHARTEAVKGFVIGFGKSSPGIDFNALDGEKVHLVFLMGADPRELNLYLRVLAELSKLLMNSAFREALEAATEADQVLEIVRQFEK